MGRSATDAELSKLTGFSLEKCKLLQNFPKSILSLDFEMNENGFSLSQIISGTGPSIEEALDSKESLRDLFAAFAQLDVIERTVVSHIYGLLGATKLTYREVAARLNTTVYDIKNIESKSMQQLRDSLDAVNGNSNPE